MKVIEVAAGLVFREGKLLITQRPAGGHQERGGAELAEGKAKDEGGGVGA